MKRYTGISNKFIDEYILFHDKCKNRKHGILLDNVIKYLKINNSKRFYEKFREKYKINSDYVIIKIKGKKVKNKKSTNYYITFDTFERICMATKAKKGNEVRDYFILLRKFIDYYKQNISDMIIKNASKVNGKYMYIILVNKGKFEI